MKPALKYVLPFAVPQRAINLTAICVVSAALAACGGSSTGGSGGGTMDGGSDGDGTQTLIGSTTDTDQDGLFDNEEATLGTDPNLTDTDGDGVSDANEDFDGDGVSNLQEYQDFTDPTDAADFLSQNVVAGGTDTTPEVTTPDACDDETSSNSDWGDNCELSRSSSYAVSSYVQGVQRILWCQDFGGTQTIDAFADGIFGPITAEAVRSFQTANGLDPDGIVGPMTWAGEDGLRSKVLTVVGPDVTINGLTYIANTIDGCGNDEHFYQQTDGFDLLGWKMAQPAGSQNLVDFSTGAPN